MKKRTRQAETLMGRLTETEAYNFYLEDLDLREEDLKDKVTLDIGVGSNPIFVNYCLEHGITDKIYGIDKRNFLQELDWYTESARKIYPEDKLMSSRGKTRYVQGKGEHLPFRREGFDLILARAILTNTGVDVERLLQEVTVALRPGGEFRAYPIFRKKNKKLRKRIDEVLEDLTKRDFEFEWKEKKTYTWSEGEVDYKDLLILRRKKVAPKP